MPSNAYTVHLDSLLLDAVNLDIVYHEMRGGPFTPARLAALNRSAVVASVSAWEAYVEELMRETLQVLRPPGPVMGAWPALGAFVLGQLASFHTPSQANVERLIRNCLGLANVHFSWAWQNCTPAQAAQRLADVLTLRHEIAHGTNPRPPVPNWYSQGLPDFFRRLARRTDAAVRQHLVTVLGVANPWPA
jgi:hypothetical protein